MVGIIDDFEFERMMKSATNDVFFTF